MTLSFSPLTSKLGAQVHGIDASNVSDEQALQFCQAFEKYHILLLRGQIMSPEESVNLTELLGPISFADSTMKKGRNYSHISNTLPDGRLPNGELIFHADHMFLKQPLKAISLYAMQVPKIGGETLFLNMSRLYRDLPEILKMRVQGLSARHIYDYEANAGSSAPDLDKLSKNTDEMIHPIAWNFSGSDELILFVSRLFTVEVVGISRDESQTLLSDLFRHIESYEPEYSHKWQVGDFLVWDNRILQHARNDFAATENRSMRRVPIGNTASSI